jgi:hypothetical protein
MTATEILAAACASGIACLNERDLLIVIAQQLGGGDSPIGGSQQVYDATTATPDDPTIQALRYPSGGGTLEQWDVASQTWV